MGFHKYNDEQKAPQTNHVQADLWKIIDKECDKNGKYTAQNKTYKNGWDTRVVFIIDKHPKIECTDNDQWSDPFLAVFHFKAFYKSQHFHDKNSQNGYDQGADDRIDQKNDPCILIP